MTPSTYADRILALIEDNGPQTIRQIKEALGLANSGGALHRRLVRLREDGILAVTPSTFGDSTKPPRYFLGADEFARAAAMPRGRARQALMTTYTTLRNTRTPAEASLKMGLTAEVAASLEGSYNTRTSVNAIDASVPKFAKNEEHVAAVLGTRQIGFCVTREDVRRLPFVARAA